MIRSLLTAQTPIAHGDPGANTDSNVLSFRMQAALYRRPAALPSPTQDEAWQALDALCLQVPLPATPAVAETLTQLTAEQFVACAFVMELLNQLNRLNGGEGAGLFTGAQRYTMLLKRLGILAAQYHLSYFSLYSALLAHLRIPEVLPGLEARLPYFSALPASFQQASIAVLGEQRQSVLLVARAWSDAQKRFGADMAHYDPAGKIAGSSATSMQAAIPHLSGNSLRHTVFRATLRDHLFRACGFGSFHEAVRDAAVPRFVAMLFSNGGNVAANARTPEQSESINAAIFACFPSLELLSGCLPTHILGVGALTMRNWTLCLQNNERTAPRGYTSDLDASDLLSEDTGTRHTPDGMDASKESGQMIFSHTVMKPGSQLLFEFDFLPYASDLAKGAAYFAFLEWLAAGGLAGGRAAQGEGGCFAAEQITLVPSTISRTQYPADLATFEALAQKYDALIHEHADELRDELVSGRLGWREALGA